MATLKEAINTAKTEPDSERSKKLKEAILSGKMDAIAAKEGLDLTAFKTKFGKEVKPTADYMKRAGQVAMKSDSEMAVDKGEVAQAGFTGDIESPEVQPVSQEQAEKDKMKEYMTPVIGPIRQTVDMGKGVTEMIGNVLGATVGKGVEKLGETKLGGGEDSFLDRFGENIQSAPKDLLGEPETKTEGYTRGAGKLLGTIATIAMNPFSVGLRGLGAKGVSQLGGGKLMQAIGANLAASPLETAVFTTGMQGELPSKGELATGAVIDGLFPAASEVLGWSGKWVGKIKDSIKSKGLSPMAYDVVQQVSKSNDDTLKAGFLKMTEDYTNHMVNPTTTSSPMADLGKQIYDDFTEALIPQQQAVGKELAEQILEADNLAKAGIGTTSSGFLQTMQEGLDDIGVKVTDTGLDFSSSTIRFGDEDQRMLNKVFGEIKKYVDQGSFIPPSEKWSLLQSLNTLSEYNSKLASQTSTVGEIPLSSLKDQLSVDLKAALEESGQAVDLFDQYKYLADIKDVLNRRIGDGGVGGFSIVKSLFGEQKFGTEVKNALEGLQGLTGTNYLDQARIVKAVGEVVGDNQVQSLLATTSVKGFTEKVIEYAAMDKSVLIQQIKDQLSGESKKLNISQSTLERVLNATLKTLGLEIVDQ